MKHLTFAFHLYVIAAYQPVSPLIVMLSLQSFHCTGSTQPCLRRGALSGTPNGCLSYYRRLSSCIAAYHPVSPLIIMLSPQSFHYTGRTQPCRKKGALTGTPNCRLPSSCYRRLSSCIAAYHHVLPAVYSLHRKYAALSKERGSDWNI